MDAQERHFQHKVGWKAGFTSNLISFTLETRRTTPILKELSSLLRLRRCYEKSWDITWDIKDFFFTMWQCNLNFLVLQINPTDEHYTLLLIFATAIWKSSTQFGFMLADHLSSAQRWWQSTNTQYWDHDIQFPADTTRETPCILWRMLAQTIQWRIVKILLKMTSLVLFS